jgi:hypothetical protein
MSASGLEGLFTESTQPAWLNPKHTKCEIPCPLGCGKPAVLAWLGNELKAAQHGDCSSEKIKAALKPKPEPSNERPKQEPPPPRRTNSAVRTSAPLVSKAPAAEPPNDPLRRLPPQNIEAEQSVLGAVFLENECLATAKSVLERTDFYRETHREIFRAMEVLASKATPIDAITMTAYLRSKDLLEQCGGSAYMAEISEATPTAANVLYYARIVREMSVKRGIAAISTDLATMAYNGVSGEALIGEFQRRAAALDTVKKNAVQDIFSANIQTLTGRDLVHRAKTNPKNRVVCDGFLYRKQVSMWAGKVEAGKTTLLRELAMDVIRGDPFLGRACVIGRVTYLMLDADGEDLTFEEFQKMGWNPETEDNLEFVFDPIFAQKPKALDQFHQYLIERQPALVIVDPLGRFIKADDFNAYGMTYVMAVISELAKSTDCHFAIPQHIPRGRNDDADAATAAFGSIAIGGSVNARFVCTHKPGNIYTLKTSRGKGSGFVPLDEEIVLEQNAETRRITLKGAYSWKDQAKALMEQVQRIVDDADDPMSAGDIAARLGIMRSAASSAAQMLYSEKNDKYRRIDREGKGKAGSPFKFKKLVQSSLQSSAATRSVPEN